MAFLNCWRIRLSRFVERIRTSLGARNPQPASLVGAPKAPRIEYTIGSFVVYGGMSRPVHHFKSGDVVEVLSIEEIAATLDATGSYEGIPFMDEMHQFCGRRFRVFKRADKICVETPYFLDLRRLRNAVTLEEVRCDGGDHDGCKRMCLVFWKEAWLKPAMHDATPERPIDWINVLAGRKSSAPSPIDPDKTYSCQATALAQATEPLRMWDVRHYVRDLRSRALRPRELAKALFTTVYNKVSRARGGRDFGMLVGNEQKTPAASLGLVPGERVRIKDKEQVVKTLDANGKNRGMYFGNEEASRHCGSTFPVLTSIDRMILEDSGKMRAITNTVLLQGTACSGLCFQGCARNGHPMWREVWLERTGESPATSGAPVSPDPAAAT